MHQRIPLPSLCWLLILAISTPLFAQRPADTPTGLRAGLAYKYYTGAFTVLPDFNTLTPVTTGIATQPDISYKQQNDLFALTFGGFVEVPTTGTYTFYTTSDDGSRLWIGDQLIVDNDGAHGPVEKSGTIDLEAGLHAITVQFFERGGGEVLTVKYAGPGISKQTIPATAYSHDIPDLPGLAYRYFEGAWNLLPDFDALTPITTGIATSPSVTYGEREDVFGLAFDGYIDVPAAGTYTLYLKSDDGSKLWIDDQLIVDNDGLHGPAEVSGTVALQKGLNPITIYYMERGGGQLLEVRYEGPGISKQLVPSTSWHRDDDSLQMYDNDAYLVPVADAANLQTLLDTYGSIRLEAADYTINGPSEIVLSSNQKIFGTPGNPGTKVPQITVSGGTRHSFVSYLRAIGSGLYFEPSSIPVSGNEFRALTSTPLTVDSAIMENNLFAGFRLTKVNINNSYGGYLRNNRFIRFTVHASYPQLIMNGNTATGFESYGNVFLWFNFLTSHSYVTQIDNQDDLTFVGVDSESWNWNLYDNRALFSTGNMGTLRLFGCQGGNNLTSDHWTQLLNTNAQEVLMMGVSVTPSRLLTPNITFGSNNLRSLNLLSKTYSYESLNLNADRITAIENDVNDFKVNGTSQTSLMSTYNQDLLDGMIRPTTRPGQPWDAPTYMNIPDPGGPIWNHNLANKPDSTTYLQNRIDTEGIVNLEPGIYYISAPLTIRKEYGLIGSGMDKTLIIAKTNDFDMIRIKNDDTTRSQNFTLCNLTLQGGKNGLVTDIANHMYTGINFSYVQFRDMDQYAILISSIYSWDNNLMDHIMVVNCPTGVKQIVDPNYTGGDTPTMTFLDKNFWYRCQFVDCGLPLDLQAYRANNLNSYVECRFDGSTTRAADFNNNLTTVFANCDLTDNAGSPMIDANNTVNYVSCRFSAGTSDIGFLPRRSTVEGCTFDANGQSNVTVITGTQTAKTVLINSQAIGTNLGTMYDGLLLNTSINGTTSRVIRYIAGTSYTLDNRNAIPVPMLLWGDAIK